MLRFILWLWYACACYKGIFIYIILLCYATVILKLSIIYLRKFSWLIKQINNLFRSVLNHSNQAMSFILAIDNQFRYFAFKLFISNTCLGKVGHIWPQYLSIIKINQKLSQIRIFTCRRVTQYFSWAILLQLEKNWWITTLSKW